MGDEIKVLNGRPYPMGLSVTGAREINLAAVLPAKHTKYAEECGVILYPKKGGSRRHFPFRKENRIGNICCMKLSGISAEDYDYNFYMGDEIVADPYAHQIHGNEHWGKKVSPALRSSYSTQVFDWGEDAHPMTPLNDSIVYQLHVRGFTKHSSSGVEHRGTFLGITEKIEYLKSLGVTAVEILPAYEFLELEQRPTGKGTMAEAVQRCTDDPEQNRARLNYWGFKKGYYFAPKASYSSGDPQTEFKTLVKRLHENGLELIMQFYFPKEVKKGFVLEVLKYWVYEYHVDGIHLMGEQMPTQLLATDPLLANTKLFYYEFPCADIYESKEAPDYKNLACCRDGFQYDMRRFLKGDEDALQQALYQLRNNPLQMGEINYITSYEGFSLADLVSYDRKHNEDNGEGNQDGNPYNASWNCGVEGPTRKRSILSLRKKQMRNAMLLLLTAQATPMLTAGDEFGQSREGNNNAYCQDNAISWLDWRLTEKNGEFLDFVRAVLKLRREHPVLHQAQELTMLDYAACGCPDLSYHGKEAWRLLTDRLSREAGVLYCGHYAKKKRDEDDSYFYIAYNMHWEEQKLALPDLPGGMHWEKVMDTQDGTTVSDGEKRERYVTIAGRSVQVLQSFGKPDGKGKKIEGATAF